MSAALLTINCKSSIWLSAFLLFLAFYLGLIILDAQDFYISPQLYFLSLSIIFLPGPILLGYIGHISDRKFISFKDYLMALLPIIVVLVSPNSLSDKSMFELANIYDYQSDSYSAFFSVVSAMAGLHILTYVLLSGLLLLKLRQDWSSYQSKTLPNSWYKMLQVLVIILIVAILQVVSSFINIDGNKVSLGDISFILLVLYFIYSAAITIRDNRIEPAAEEIIVSHPSETYFQTMPSSFDDLALEPNLEALGLLAKSKLENDELFLQDDLSLSSLAFQLDTTTHKLSLAINALFKITFYEFINDFRVKYAALELVDKPKMSITDVYFSAGFTTKSTFYSYFKKSYGCTPSQYRKNNTEES